MGKISIKDLRELANKRAGSTVAFDLNKENPTEVAGWIPTGSHWLNSMICRGKVAGIPVGKITELAGLEATGKSYMATQIAANAQRMGMNVVYFDSENSISPKFLQKAGCEVGDLLYIQATSVEYVLETIEEYCSLDQGFLFIWDSLALTPCRSDISGDFDPQSSMAMKARVVSKGLQKILVPVANSKSALLVLNQLKTNMTNNFIERKMNPYVTSGGMTLAYAYSLRIWLSGSKAKASFVEDERGYRIGSQVKATIKKSRFGSEGRKCDFKILWAGDEIGVQDEDSWLDAIKTSPRIIAGGAWYTLIKEGGEEKKFQRKNWREELKDPAFRKSILDIIDEEVVIKFDQSSEEKVKDDT